MLECVEEVNESKRLKAYFTDGTILNLDKRTLRQGHTSIIKTKN